MFKKKGTKRIYFDYAAATPVRPEVLKAMQPFFSDDFANPGAIHQEGVKAKEVVEAARLTLSRVLHVRAEDVYFTASGTESNNLAIAGVVEAAKQSGREYEDMEVITTAIEHPSVTEVLAHYRTLGVRVIEVPVGEDGLINIAEFTACLSPKTVLVSCAYVNSEIGTIMPIRQLSRVVATHNRQTKSRCIVHADAAQAPLWLPCAPHQLGADILTLDAGKCYGPKGVGVVVMRHGLTLKPHFFGGGQERGLRPGTENVPSIIGAVTALEMAQASYKERSEKVGVLRDYAIAALTQLEGVVLNGSATERVANNVNISIAGVEAEFAAITLDTAGIACSTKSACGSGKGKGSTVVRTITGDEDRAVTSLRFTFGEATEQSEIDYLVAELAHHIEKTRAFNEKLTG